MAVQGVVQARHTISDDIIEGFRANLRGDVLLPGDEGYDDRRRVWNAMVDKHPAMIACCTGTADVVTAVNFARTHGLKLAVKGGGHNVAGSATNDGGLVIDLSPMRGIHVDPSRRTARVQAGATWGDLDHETQLHGLVTPGGVVSTTGVAGFTLAGGMSYIRRKWGLACDNLIGAEVVTADGRVVTTNDRDHPDLFWAIRGGGGNFGIVSSFEFQLHALGPEFYVAATVYPMAEAGQIIRSWRSYFELAPDEVTTDIVLWSMFPLPDIAPELVDAPIIVVFGAYAGSPEDGVRELQPLREFGAPLVDLSQIGRYTDIQSGFDSFFPDTQRYYWKSLFIDELTDQAIDTMVEIASDKPTTLTAFGLRGLGGAMSRVPETATAYGNRESLFNLSFDTIWLDPADDEGMVAWTRNAWSRMHALTGGGVYLNFAGLGEENDSLARGAYGRNYDRLTKVKRDYDPTNLFCGNVNIVPEGQP